MPDTGWKNPTAVDAASTFSNPSNVFTSNNLYASAASAGKIVIPYNFSFLVGTPGFLKVISLIEVRIEAKIGLFGTSATLDVNLSRDGGSSYLAHTKSATWVAADGEVYKTVTGFETGENLKTWETFWTSDHLSDANFRIKVTVASIGVGTSILVDNVQAKVTYQDIRIISPRIVRRNTSQVVGVW